MAWIFGSDENTPRVIESDSDEITERGLPVAFAEDVEPPKRVHGGRRLHNVTVRLTGREFFAFARRARMGEDMGDTIRRYAGLRPLPKDLR